MLQDVRCEKCNCLLFKADGSIIEIIYHGKKIKVESQTPVVVECNCGKVQNLIMSKKDGRRMTAAEHY